MKLKLIQRGNPQKPAEAKKWFATTVNQGTVSKRELSKEIAGRSSLTQGDISNVIDNLVDELPKYLASGQSVKLGEFGSFRLSVSGEGANSKEEFHTSLVKKVKIVFTPGLALKKELQDIHFEIKREE